ncbi:MAG: hypothetical protein ACK4RV_11835 [Caulobacter sp.]
MSVDLLARLRLEATAGDAPKVVGSVEKEVDALGKSAERTADRLQKAGEAADKLAPPAAKAGEAADRAAKSLDAASEAADRFRDKAAESASAGEDLGDSLKGLGDQAINEALGRVTDGARRSGEAVDGMGGAAGRSGGMMAGLVRTLVGGAGVAAAMAAVNYVIGEYNAYNESMIEGQAAAASRASELAQELRDLTGESEDLASVTDALKISTASSAHEALMAADAYDLQALAALRAAKAIREKSAAEVGAEIQAVETRIENMERRQRGGGIWDPVTIQDDERLAASKRRMLTAVFGNGRSRERLDGTATPEEAYRRFDAGRLDARQRAAVADYKIAAEQFAGTDRVIAADRAYLEELRRSAVLGPEPATDVEEIIVQGERRKGRTSRGSGRSAQDAAARERERRLAQASEGVRITEAETRAMEAQVIAMAKGEAALEAWRITEAGRQAVVQAGLDETDKLTTAEARAAEAVRTSAEARERQLIVLEKASQVRAVTDSLDEQIAGEQAYALALTGSTKALVDHERAEFVRQELERAGKNLTAEQTQAITERAEALFRLKAVNEDLAGERAFQEELKLARLTAEEREREQRALELKSGLLAQHAEMTEAEALAIARVRAAREQALRGQAEEMAQLKESYRTGFIDGGELAFDDIAEYGERKLREMVYDALLKEPIDLVIEATVKVLTAGLEDFLRQVLAAASIGGRGGVGSGGGGGLDWAALFGQPTGGTSSSGGAASALMSAWMMLGGGGAAAGGGLASSFLGGVTGATGATAVGGGLFGGLGALMATPAGWIGAAAMALANHEQILQSFVDNGRKRIQAIGGNERVAEMQLIPNSWRPIVASLGNGNSNNGGRLLFEDGFWTVGGNKASKQTKERLAGAGEAIEQLIAGLEAIGISARGIITKVQLGDRDPTRVTTADGTVYSDPRRSVEALMQLITTALLSEAEYEDPALKAIVDQMLDANRNWEQILERMERFVAAQEARKDLELELLSYTDPRAAALLGLERSQAERRRAFEGFNTDGLYTDVQWATIQDQLAALEAEELAAVLESLGDAATDAARALADAAPRLRDWLDAMGFSDAAQLNPFEERQLAYAQYERQLEKARAGDAEALADITAYAERLLAADAEATSSAQERLALFNLIMSQITALAGQTAPIGESTTTSLAGGGTVTTGAGGETVVTTSGGETVVVTAGGEVVAAVDQLRLDVVQRLDALKTTVPTAMGVMGEGLGELLERIREQAAEQRVTTEEVLRELIASNAWNRAAQSRVTQ